MPIKEININNSLYKVVCREGQESHLNTLSEKLNSRIEELKKAFKGKCSELTLVVLAALDLEDQLNERCLEVEEIKDCVSVRINKIIQLFDSKLG